MKLFAGPGTHLAFVSQVEDVELRCECIDRAWLAQVWRELGRSRFATPHGRRTGHRIVLDFTAGRSFDDAFAASDVAGRAALAAVSRWFATRCAGGPDGMAPRPEIRLHQWPWPGGADAANRLRNCWLALDLAPADGAPHTTTTTTTTTGQPDAVRLLGEPEQAVLQALHFPAPDADGGDDAGDGDAQDAGPGERGLLARLRDHGGTTARLLRDWLEETFTPPQLAPAGGAMPPPRAPRPRKTAPALAYIGSPKTAPADAGGQPNPMCAAGTQSIVGLLDVGQGNCNMIIGANHNVLAYFDFGITMSGDAPAQLVKPCFCSSPYIILSHWDFDHFMLHTRAPESLRCTWIAPRQKSGPLGSALIGNIKQAGGRIYIWAATSPSHMNFPWGYLERCSGDAKDANSSGLAAWVCVRDRPAPNQVTPGSAPWSAAGPARSLEDAGTSELINRARAALADAAITGLPLGIGQDLGRCLASVLGNSRFSAGLGAHGCAAAAAQVALAFQAAVGAAPLVPAPAAIMAAANANNDCNGIAAAELPRALHLIAVGVTSALTSFRSGYSTPNNAACCSFGIGAVPSEVVDDVRAAAATAGIAAITGTLLAVAAALAAALQASRYQHRLTRAQALSIAVRAVDAAITSIGGAAMLPDPATVPGIATGGGAMDGLPASISGRQRAAGELAVAAVAGYHALSLGLPVEIAAECAAGGFLPPASAIWPQPAAGALTPAPAAGSAPQVRAVVPPFDAANERYVLLTGDANFDCIPSCAANPPPTTVGLAAMHHGSFLEGSVYLNGTCIPWAPGTPGAAMARRAHAQVAANPRLIDFICDLAHNGAAPAIAATVPHADHVARAAAAALQAAHDNSPDPANDMLFNPDTAVQAAAAAAAAAFAAYLVNNTPALGDSHAVGVAAALPQTMTKMTPLSTPPGALAQAALAIYAQRAAIDARAVTVASRGIVGATRDIDYAGQVAAAVGPLVATGLPLDQATAAATATAVATAALAGFDDPALAAVYGNATGDIARAATAAILGGPGAEAASAGVAAHAAGIAAAVARLVNDPRPQPPALADTMALAARWAAEAVAAERANASLDTLWAVVNAVGTNALVAAAALPAAVVSARIAYSYGVAADGTHAHRSVNLGKYGHPHPPALAFYAARGWTERRNVSHRAGLAPTDPNHPPQQDGANPAGHAGLCWNAAGDAGVPAGVHQFTCPHCHNTIPFFV
jgi:hypothetical protein